MLVKRHAHKALRGQVVYLVGWIFFHYGNAGAQIGQVVFDQVQIGVVLDAQLFDASEVNSAGAAVGAVDGVAFFEQPLREVGSSLACDAGND